MERTDLREQFFAEAMNDPYLHAVMTHVANAWAMGYEQALRDNGLDEQRYRETHSDRYDRALEWLTDDRRKAHAQALIAFAELGKIVARSAGTEATDA